MCNKLCVMGESSGPKPDNVTTSSFKMSVYHGEAASDYSEERYFKSLRAWHISRSPLCRPVWLYEAPSHEVLEEALKTFIDLTEKVSTQQPKDLVRALVPMLTNSPAETETDLMRLLGALDMMGHQNARIRQMITTFKARTMPKRQRSQPGTQSSASGGAASPPSTADAPPSVSLQMVAHHGPSSQTLTLPPGVPSSPLLAPM